MIACVLFRFSVKNCWAPSLEQVVSIFENFYGMKMDILSKNNFKIHMPISFMNGPLVKCNALIIGIVWQTI